MCVCAWRMHGARGERGVFKPRSLAFRMSFFIFGEGILHGSDNALVLVGVFT